jgi:menaquinone-dependent protoporphyrinogen oxidase
MKSVLVCYATRYGSTGEIASVIARELETGGFEVTLSPLSLVENPGIYSAVVIGSPLYMGKWLVEARDFVSRFRKELQGLPVAVFTVGYSFGDRMKEHIASSDDALAPVRIFLIPVAAGNFPGRIDTDRMSLTDREIIRLAGITPGDFLDRDEARQWARKIVPRLFPSGT